MTIHTHIHTYIHTYIHTLNAIQGHQTKTKRKHSGYINVFDPIYSGANLSVSMIGGGGDTTILSPGRSPKQPLPSIGLHDPLHDRQACPAFNSFYQGFGQISPHEGLFSCRPFPKRGQICDMPYPPPIVERLIYAFRCTFDVSAGLWKEEKVYSITVGFSPTLYC